MIVTNIDLPAAELWRLYRGRADCENRIKELKYDFGGDSLNLKNFWATEAALLTVMMAYNLMSLFRQGVMRSNTVS
ncbi:transposase, partial [Nitrosomonas supralitoralis]